MLFRSHPGRCPGLQEARASPRPVHVAGSIALRSHGSVEPGPRSAARARHLNGAQSAPNGSVCRPLATQPLARPRASLRCASSILVARSPADRIHPRAGQTRRVGRFPGSSGPPTPSNTASRKVSRQIQPAHPVKHGESESFPTVLARPARQSRRVGEFPTDPARPARQSRRVGRFPDRSSPPSTAITASRKVSRQSWPANPVKHGESESFPTDPARQPRQSRRVGEFPGSSSAPSPSNTASRRVSPAVPARPARQTRRVGRFHRRRKPVWCGFAGESEGFPAVPARPARQTRRVGRFPASQPARQASRRVRSRRRLRCPA